MLGSAYLEQFRGGILPPSGALFLRQCEEMGLSDCIAMHIAATAGAWAMG